LVREAQRVLYRGLFEGVVAGPGVLARAPIRRAAGRREGTVDPVELARRLIDIPSVSGEEEAVARFLASHLERLGYRVELLEAPPRRPGLVATTGAPPRLVFSTHLDTVPPHFASGEDDEYVYGRGACDAKGILAAELAAAERLRAEGRNDLGLLFVVDEERGSVGARVANAHPVARECRWLIDGEPTENKLAVGCKGSLRVTLRAEGTGGHSAYPERGRSAIHVLLDALDDVRAVAWPTDEYFGDTTCNIGVIVGGTQANVIAPDARADLHIRLVTDQAPVRELLERAVGSQARIEYLSFTPPVRLTAVPDFEQCVVGYTTDVPHLSNWGTPLLLGPGSIHDAHTARERIAKAELERGVPLVEGTAGWQAREAEARRVVEDAGGAMVYGPNFSIGVNLFYRVVENAAGLVRGLPAYDAFIEEAHHVRKRDAPSGTALQLRKILARELGGGREVAIASTRAGHIPGVHRVGFDSAADQITLVHTARSRDGFAAGALAAARWLPGRRGVFAFAEALDEILEAERKTTP